MGMDTSRTQRGFTLIEIMLSLALTALLLSLLSGGMYAVMNDWERDTDVLDDRLDETITILQVERALKGAFPHSYRDDTTSGSTIYFQGNDESLSWVSTVSPQRSGGLMAWHLESRSGEGVFLTLVPAMSDNPGERLDNAEPIVLLENYEATFSYLYEDLDFSKQWRDDWLGEEMNALPLAVHIVLTPIDNDNTQIFEVVANIAANTHRSIRATLNGSSGAPVTTRNTPFGEL